MHFSLPFKNCCKGQISEPSLSKTLPLPSSSFLSTSLLAKFAAASLVTASAGLGCVFAFTSGLHQGPALACLLVLMALGLELAKPLSIAAAFDALRSFRFVQGAALALLGAVAVTYSLTAELSLVAQSRGDLIAERTASYDTATKASDRYDRAKLELLTLEPTRPKAELDQKIAGLLLTPGVDGCAEINGKITRQLCPQVAELRVEAARAERRDTLEATMREAEKEAAIAPAKAADPGATALAMYLALIGLTVDPKLLSNLLVLVAVIALEAGSALALVMVRAVEPVASNQPARTVVQPVNEPVVQPAPELPAVPVVHAGKTADVEAAETVREEVKKRVLKHLRDHGGKARGSQRGLARLMGVDKTTMRRAISALVAAGALAAEASARNGTALRLLS